MKFRIFLLCLIASVSLYHLRCSSSESVPPVPPDDLHPSLGSGVVQIKLPVDLAEVTRIGSFGSHHGSHPEGLDHVGFDVGENTQIKAPARGYVVNISEEEEGHYKITFEHSDIMVSYLDHLRSLADNIEEGMIVEQGDLIGYPENMGGTYAAEIALVDGTVETGPINTMVAYHLATGVGSYVSPYLFLSTEDRAALESVYGALNDPEDLCDYNLENEIFSHESGSVVGAWVTTSEWQSGGYPEIIAFKTCDHRYHTGNHRFVYIDRTGCGGTGSTDGDYDVDESKNPKWVNLNNAGHYGIYEIVEVDGEERLKIEWANSAAARPTSFSSAAVTYVQRPRKIECE